MAHIDNDISNIQKPENQSSVIKLCQKIIFDHIQLQKNTKLGQTKE